MKVDRNPLDPQQCLRLLAGMAVGRVVYTVDALPAVLPVRFRLDEDGSVLLRAPERSELVKAVDGAVIAFEAGEVSDTDGSGWSVTVLGHASVATGPAGQRSADGGAAPVPAAAVSDQVVIRIRPELVTGRRLEAPPAVPTA